MTPEFSKLIQALLQKNKGVMSKMHSMIFPKADQNKTLEQLTDVFARYEGGYRGIQMHFMHLRRSSSFSTYDGSWLQSRYGTNV
jgi:hypothetical protein